MTNRLRMGFMTTRWAIAFFVVLLCVPICIAAVQSDLTIVDAQRRNQTLDELIQKLADKRVVFIGETHDRYDNHLSQSEIIRRLHTRDPQRWVIGVEYFQRPFQSYLDAYIAGDITEREFLSKTEYFDRWSFDYRLYRPIFQYACEQHIPLVALNAERELTDRVSKAGLAGLSPAERARLPQDIDKSDAAYRERLHSVYEEHRDTSGNGFERFEEVQLVWDETMAQQISNYLAAHPDKSMIVVAGEGHIAFGSGIPNRVKRRIPGIETAILLPADKSDEELKGADYLLVSTELSLPPAGRMGVATSVADGVRAREVTAGGPAALAGMRPRDRIVAINGEAIQSAADLRLALLDRAPGDRVSVRVQRDGEAGARSELSLQLTLQK
jgi:uncharacterized iron-regulated protein